MASHLETVLGFQSIKHHGAKIAGVLGVDAPALTKRTPPTSDADALAQRAVAIEDSRGAAVGAVAGAVFWKKHRILGAIGGAMVGASAPALMNANERETAIYNLGHAGAAVGGSLLWKQHPIWGFLAGTIGAGIVRRYVIKK